MKESNVYSLSRLTPRLSFGWGLFFSLLFLYFLTISMELLSIQLYLFKPKINHLIACFLFIWVVMHCRFYALPKKLSLSVFILLLSQLISASFSPCLSRSYGYIGVNFLTLLLFFFLPIQCMLAFDSKKILKLYFASFLVIGSYAALQFSLSFLGIELPGVRQKMFDSVARGQAFFYEPSFYALYAIGLVMYFNAKTLLSSQNWIHPSTIFPLLSVNFLLISSTSTSVFFAYLFFVFLFLWSTRCSWIVPFIENLNRKVLKMTCFFILFFSLFCLSFPKLFLHTFYKFFYLGFFSHGSFLERWESSLSCWRLFCEHPLFGVGLGGVGPYLHLEQHSVDQMASFTTAPLELFEYFDPHNVFFEVLASLGIVGFFSVCLFLRFAYRLFKETFKTGALSLEERVTLYSLFFSSILILLCLQFNQGLFRPYVWLHLGISIGYALQLKKKVLS